jgi:translation initiation factor 1
MQPGDDELFSPDVAGVTTRATLEVHIRIQSFGRKQLTLVEGLPAKLDFKKVLQHWKHKFCCNGNTVEGGTTGTVIQLQGDKRSDVQGFLIGEKICTKDQIVIHGAQL